jgi:putative protein-disulfide isomerase
MEPSKEYRTYEALQQAFYAQGKDITELAIIAEVIASVGIDKTAFSEKFRSDAMKRATAADKQKARTYGVSSFPTLITIDRQGHLSQIRGYKKYEELQALIRR